MGMRINKLSSNIFIVLAEELSPLHDSQKERVASILSTGNLINFRIEPKGKGDMICVVKCREVIIALAQQQQLVAVPLLSA